ncbi:MAG: hypothetical protein KJ861_14820, partial [Alphaproteobacteria bacterium]|nr:hypothetical protein [Alphaproteobacteria bacterium]
ATSAEPQAASAITAAPAISTLVRRSIDIPSGWKRLIAAASFRHDLAISRPPLGLQCKAQMTEKRAIITVAPDTDLYSPNIRSEYYASHR